jgi:hypothetical protein
MSAGSVTLPVTPAAKRPSLRTLLVIVLALALPIGIIGARLASRTDHSAQVGQVGTAPPRSAALEDAFGIRFTQVDLVAAQGMIQLRYQVLDQSKATAIHDAKKPQNTPSVIDQTTGQHLVSPTVHGHNVPAAGRTVTTFVINTNEVVKPGSLITVVVGDIKIPNVVVNA